MRRLVPGTIRTEDGLQETECLLERELTPKERWLTLADKLLSKSQRKYIEAVIDSMSV
jgi:hypothetical protein